MYHSNGKDTYYYCRTPKLTDAYHCHGNTLPEADMKAVVLTTIRTFARLAVDIERLIESKKDSVETEKSKVVKELQSLRAKKNQLGTLSTTLYEKLVFSEISEEDYCSEKTKLSSQLIAIESQICSLEEKVEAYNALSYTPEIDAFKNYTEVDILTDEIATELLNRMTVYLGGQLDIKLNFMDELTNLAETIA